MKLFSRKSLSLLVPVLAVVLLLSGCVNQVQQPKTIETIKIGVIAPMSGDAAAYGEQTQKVLDYILPKINEEAVAPVLRTQLATIIKKLNREHGFAIVVIEHNLKFLFDLVDKVVVLVDGEKYMEGKPEEIQKDKRLQEIYFGGSV